MDNNIVLSDCGRKINIYNEYDEYEKREAEKEYVLGIIKELFEGGRIDIDINIYNKWEEKLADVIIKIDGEKVHTCTSRIGWTDWSDD